MPHPFSLLPDRLAIVRLAAGSPTPAWALAAGGFASITRTRDEVSVACAESAVPAGVASDSGWRCLKLQGPFAFDQTGVLSSFAVPLARAGVGIFAISTFDTDYILVKQRQCAAAIDALLAAGHPFAGDRHA